MKTSEKKWPIILCIHNNLLTMPIHRNESIMRRFSIYSIADSLYCKRPVTERERETIAGQLLIFSKLNKQESELCFSPSPCLQLVFLSLTDPSLSEYSKQRPPLSNGQATSLESLLKSVDSKGGEQGRL